MTDSKTSTHIFIFPFSWDYIPENKTRQEIDYSERTNLNHFETNLDLQTQWQKIENHPVNTPQSYNKSTYFYNFAKDAIFPSQKNKNLLRVYEYKTTPNSTYTINIQTQKESPNSNDKTNKKIQKEYILKIEKILLSAYSTGVALLSYHLENQSEYELSDILKINEYGRRIYPPFLNDITTDGTSKDDTPKITDGPKAAILANSLTIQIDEKQIFKEDFSHYENISQIEEDPQRLSNTITKLLGHKFKTNNHKTPESKIQISPIVDDRMFVISQHHNPELCRTLSQYDPTTQKYNYENNNDWYKYIFVDTNDATCKSIPLKQKLLKDHTYDRWIAEKYCSLFGLSRYSFMLLTDGPSFVDDHIKSLYFEMVKLILVQRASILRFSDETTCIASLEENQNTTESITKLHKKYISFVNKIFFREITAQEQGIELYDMLATHMKIERDVKDLNREIDELHQYASLIEEKRRNQQLHKLTFLGALFLIPTFITGFFGMNILPKFTKAVQTAQFSTVLIGIPLMATLIILYNHFSSKWHQKKKLIKCCRIITGILIVLIIFLLISGILFNLMGVGT